MLQTRQLITSYQSNKYMETSKESLDITGLDGGSLGQLVKAELDSDSAPDYKFIARCMQNVPYGDVPLFNLAFLSSERKYRTLIEEVSSNITDDPELLKSFQAITKCNVPIFSTKTPS
jgi:hypothetical protein